MIWVYMVLPKLTEKNPLHQTLQNTTFFVQPGFTDGLERTLYTQ